MTETEQQEPVEDQDYAESWKPEKGDMISGTVVTVSLSPDFGYGPYPIVTLNTSQGERAVHAFHTVLRTELAKRKPRHGDDLEITYLGTRSPKSGKGKDFHLYRVSGGTEPEFNWDNELPDYERQEQAQSVPIASTPVPAQTASQPAQPVSGGAVGADDDLPF